MKKALAVSVFMCLALAMLGALGSKESGTYPNGPVSVIVPYGAGGGTDSVCRALVDAAKDAFPAGIAVENRTGGGGSVGMSYGQNAKPDGQIITMITVELVTLPHTGTGGDISFEKFAPILMVNSAYSAITVPVDSPYKTLNDLLNAAKTKDIQIGNSGIGAIWHLAATGLQQAAGVKFTHIPFDGAAPAITSLLGKHIDAVSVSYAEVSAQIQAGKLKALAVLAPERLAACPDVPTAKELGYDIAIGTWRGLGVPAATPAETVLFLEKTFTDAANSEQFKTFMRNTNNDIELLTSVQFKGRLAVDNALFRKLIGNIGLSAK
ncbi:tripartite tricarboxylate transporter substrate binding protein [Treponema lecithinolyticum]|uniref:tripartite tricarboxylate transporter substrate binding protein n=1 Tax=Treponema lecithinolyticum TaxID=53418 RepID=UPI0028E980A4|nr:tripartite tricarboxylate transporter substrate binding protein [Treponema lecithinolyticum]